MPRRVTLKTIAHETGLSVQAVSMALRNHKDIAAATRERVRAKADELGYRPDPALRALADYRARGSQVSSRWDTIALLHNWSTATGSRETQFHRDWKRYLDTAAKAQGLKLSLHWVGPEGDRTERVLRQLRNRGITGVLIAPPSLTASEPQPIVVGPEFQVVTFGPDHLYHTHHSVQADYYGNLRLAWTFLREQGHRRIGLVYRKLHDWRTGHAWRAAYHIEKELAGFPPEELPPLALAPESEERDESRYVAWCRQHRFDAVISSSAYAADWTARMRTPPALALFNVQEHGGLQGIDLNLPQMAETALELLLLEMQRSLVDRTGLPFRVHIPGRWVAG